MKRILLLAPLLALVLAVTGPAVWAQQNPENPCGPKAQNPCNPCGGKAANPCGGKAMTAKYPAVNPCHAKMGTVFYIADPMARNTVTFTSEAPLEDIVGITNQITGYIVFDPDNPNKGAKGEIVVPAASLTTGIPLRDEHLQGPGWLGVAEHGTIRYRIEMVKNVRVVKETPEYKTFELITAGPFELNGRTREVEAEARITYLKETEQTKQKMPGDLLAARASFEVSLAHYGIQGFDGVVGSKVGETIDVSVRFTASTKGPSMAANPCNPCGKKAKNPCGGKAGTE